VEEHIDQLVTEGIAEVLRMLIVGHASRGEKTLPEINLKVTGYWVKEVIRIDIK
jgi:hypothetical protein